MSAARAADVLGKVYNRLHLGERTTVVSSREFLQALVSDLAATIIGARPIALRSGIDDVELTSSQAVPIGLIVNELIENALKHAFPDDRPGEIHVRFEHRDGECSLTVSGDGIGRPPSPRTGGGSRLVASLAQQLGGRLTLEGPPGTRVTTVVPLNQPRGV